MSYLPKFDMKSNIHKMPSHVSKVSNESFSVMQRLSRLEKQNYKLLNVISSLVGIVQGT